MSVTISGASDDLIEVEGDIREEWSPDAVDEDHGSLVTLSTGHVFRVRFGRDGWEIRLLVGDTSVLTWSRVGEDDADDQVDVAASVEWVVCDDRLERARADAS